MNTNNKFKGYLYLAAGGIIFFIIAAPFALKVMGVMFAIVLINTGLKLLHMPPIQKIIQYGLEDLRRNFFNK